jgi:2-iminobutanoate/2-iminopropanoate deaminase
MKREVIRVEPLSTYLERWKAPTSAITRSGDTIYVSGFPPFDPDTGEVVDAPIERQTELVLEQMKLCLETAGSSLENVLKCNVYCTSVDKFAAVNAIYSRYFPKDPPPHLRERPGLARAFRYRDRLCRSGLESLVASGRPCHRLWLKEPPPRQPGYLDGDWIFDPSRPSMRPRILILNDFAPSTNSTRTIRDGVGTIRLLDGPGNRIALS